MVHCWRAHSDTAALISSDDLVIIGAVPPYDSNKSRGKCLFCNTTTDHLGPKHLSNKAATRVKKKAVVAGSPEQITIEDSDEVDVPEGTEEDSPQKKSRATYPPKHNTARAAMSDQSKKKLPSIIELSSDSTSPTTSDYKPTDDIEMKEEDHDSYKQASSSSRKRKSKTTFSLRKTKRAAGDQSDKVLPPSKPSKGKQRAQVTGKR